MIRDYIHALNSGAVIGFAKAALGRGYNARRSAMGDWYVIDADGRNVSGAHSYGTGWAALAAAELLADPPPDAEMRRMIAAVTRDDEWLRRRDP